MSKWQLLFIKQSRNFSWNVFTLKMGPIVCPETSVIISLRCVTSKKSEGLIYTAAKVWSHSLTKSVECLLTPISVNTHMTLHSVVCSLTRSVETEPCGGTEAWRGVAWRSCGQILRDRAGCYGRSHTLRVVIDDRRAMEKWRLAEQKSPRLGGHNSHMDSSWTGIF